MALKKTFTLNSGSTGEYLRIVAHRWDRQSREASAIIALFQNSTRTAPILPVFGKIRLQGEDFDKANTQALGGSNHVAQLYAAAKAGYLISDFGAMALANAEDV